VLAVALAAFVFAAPAGAEVLTGHGTWAPNIGLNGEVDIVGATASYDSTTGAVVVTITTRDAPTYPDFAVGSDIGSGCGGAFVDFTAHYTEPEAEVGYGEFDTAIKPAPNTVTGDTRTVSFASSAIANQKSACVELQTQNFTPHEEDAFDTVSFTLSGPASETPPSDSTSSQSGSSNTQSTPQPPGPAQLSIAGRKPVKAKPGAWKQVKVQVSDPGGTATGPVQLKVKAPAGVALKPGSGKLSVPALQPGESKTVAFKIRLTEKAKASSTLSLVATAAGLHATRSLVVESAAG
jgi:hypothetical protein